MLPREAGYSFLQPLGSRGEILKGDMNPIKRTETGLQKPVPAMFLIVLVVQSADHRHELPLTENQVACGSMVALENRGCLEVESANVHSAQPEAADSVPCVCAV